MIRLGRAPETPLKSGPCRVELDAGYRGQSTGSDMARRSPRRCAALPSPLAGAGGEGAAGRP